MEFTQAPPGFFPHLVLALWVPLVFVLFVWLRPRKAIFVVMLGGALFLPERAAFDGPFIPPLGKHELTALCAFVACWIFSADRMKRARLGRGIDVLMTLYLVGVAITVLTNPERIVTGAVVRPGYTTGELISTLGRELLRAGLAFYLGRAAFESSGDLRTFYRLLLRFGFIYSLLMLVEVRLSPQLHRWIYGYHAHSFAQTMRGGGFRPTVFMEHGLAVGLFAMILVVAACVYYRARSGGIPNLVAWLSILYLTVVLILCKSTGALGFGLVLIPVAIWCKARTQLRIAALGAALCVIYPASKLIDVFPRDQLVAIADDLAGEQRGSSLNDRFENDAMLIDRARVKLWFGWGDYGRNRVFNQQGKDLSVTDGYWIIQLGSRGLVGLTFMFALLLVPIFWAGRILKQVPDDTQRLLLSGLALVVLSYAFDLLPNGLYNQLPLFVAGGLARLCRELPREAAAAAYSQAGWEGGPA